MSEYEKGFINGDYDAVLKKIRPIFFVGVSYNDGHLELVVDENFATAIHKTDDHDLERLRAELPGMIDASLDQLKEEWAKDTQKTPA